MTRSIRIAGAGLAGLCCALELARRGADVTVFETALSPRLGSVARFAGGMLAPWCERESAEEEVVSLGAGAADWWAQVTQVQRRGTLVVAPARDRGELARFGRRTRAFETVDADRIAALEPALKGRFSTGLFFDQEAHLDPRRALHDLARAAQIAGVQFHYNTSAPTDVDLNCTGMAANLPGLRPVRGEMAILHCPDVHLTRTVRLLHPRMPLYIVPRGDGHYMIGGTMIESNSDRPPSLRSLSELMSAAFTVDPGFAEASVVEIGAGLRPAFVDNLPRIVEQDGVVHLNGLYRHGFLLAPAMAAKVANHFIKEDHHADLRKRAPA